MKVLVIGSGGREHAICFKLSQEPDVDKIYCAPGNAGISQVAECVDIKDNDIDSLLRFSKENNIDLTIVGPELPLVNGIVDVFEKENLKIFGPNKACAELEGSKSFSKEFMIRHDIPTAKYKEYKDLNLAINEVDNFGYPVVIKADGLAAGKGVVIAKNKEDAIYTIEEMLEKKKFGSACEKIVIEEFLEGTEISILAFVDENNIIPMVSSKDHKKVFNNETGLNTGGMGTFSPSEVYSKDLEKDIEVSILNKTLDGLRRDNLRYKGIIFIGIMLTNDGPKVLEYNVRFGDPETQSILFRLDTDLNKIMNAVIENKLSDINIEYKTEESVCVILTSGGYPEAYEVNKEIKGIEDIDEDVVIFHSGTKLIDNKIVTNGGRVLGVTARGKTVLEASNKVYENIKKISFENMHYRTDIGTKSLI